MLSVLHLLACAHVYCHYGHHSSFQMETIPLGMLSIIAFGFFCFQIAFNLPRLLHSMSPLLVVVRIACQLQV